jgi:hypothetical protein
MITAYALVGIDGEVHAVVTERQQLENHLANQEFDMGETIQEFEYNDEPMTERGKELAAKIQALMQNVRKFHMNKQIGFYQVSVDDRLQIVYDALTRLDADIEHYPPSLDAELETHGIRSSIQE